MTDSREIVHPLMQTISDERFEAGFVHRLPAERLHRGYIPGVVRLIIPEPVGRVRRVEVVPARFYTFDKLHKAVVGTKDNKPVLSDKSSIDPAEFTGQVGPWSEVPKEAPETVETVDVLATLDYRRVAPRGRYSDLIHERVVIEPDGKINGITDTGPVATARAQKTSAKITTNFSGLLNTMYFVGYAVGEDWVGEAEEEELAKLSPEGRATHLEAERIPGTNPEDPDKGYQGYIVPPLRELLATILQPDFQPVFNTPRTQIVVPTNVSS